LSYNGDLIFVFSYGFEKSVVYLNNTKNIPPGLGSLVACDLSHSMVCDKI
jgi:hypothetical protein